MTPLSPSPPLSLIAQRRDCYNHGKGGSIVKWRIPGEPDVVKTRLLILLLAALLLRGTTAVRSDELHLRGGGRITGEWLNRGADDQPYAFRTSAGIEIHVPRVQVARAVATDKPVEKYRRFAATARDTADDQWRMAEWCREQGLHRERVVHLERVVALNPDHGEARHGLGYRFWHGQWITPEEFHRRADHVLHRGRWVTRQHVELAEQRQQSREAQQQWTRKLARLRHSLESNKSFEAEAALRELQSIDDADAVRPLAELLRRERVRGLQYLYIDRLAAIDTPPSVAALMAVTTTTFDIELFDRSIRHLARRRDPAITGKYVELLTHQNNRMVNRAALALRELDASSAVSPLIDALVTTHVYWRPQAEGRKELTVPQAGALSPPGEPRNYTLGTWVIGNKLEDQIIVRDHFNQEVLKTLSELTGRGYGFDERMWRIWYNADLQIRQQRSLSARVMARP